MHDHMPYISFKCNPSN